MVAVIAVALGLRAGDQADAGRYLSQPQSAGDLRRPALRRHGSGADGRAAHQLLRVPLSLHQRHPSRREQEHAGHGPDEALLPSRHGHGPGHGRDDQLRQSRAGLHAAGNGLAVRHAVRHGERAGRLSGALERDARPGGDSRPGAVSRAADFRESAGRVRAAAVRRQRTIDCRAAQARLAAVLSRDAGRSDHRLVAGQHRSAHRAICTSATTTRSCRSIRWCARSTSWATFRFAPA